ncbi:Glyoxalase-like domain protein [Bacillus sp. THAF10]|uniref:VOC family protein n=1 Tax=Bacillus sp. THAF10 TaxID=2587848 RepID=UPI001268D1A5|nr:VOC family protein [Bacillus sp. THAF10]QFT88300.1 Glyoxalase-like domain protein [Bacillus sp. THAF10]
MIKRMDHIVLFCKDTEASKDWYEKAGFTLSHGYEGMFWFKLGEGLVMLHPAEETNAGLTEVHAAVSDVYSLFNTVKEKGLLPVDHQNNNLPLEGPVTRPWGDIQFELEDLDGHRWAFTQRDE